MRPPRRSWSTSPGKVQVDGSARMEAGGGHSNMHVSSSTSSPTFHLPVEHHDKSNVDLSMSGWVLQLKPSTASPTSIKWHVNTPTRSCYEAALPVSFPVASFPTKDLWSQFGHGVVGFMSHNLHACTVNTATPAFTPRTIHSKTAC